MSPAELVLILEAKRRALLFFEDLSTQVHQIKVFMVVAFAILLTIQLVTLGMVLRQRIAK